jgi:hypothetical protein
LAWSFVCAFFVCDLEAESVKIVFNREKRVKVCSKGMNHKDEIEIPKYTGGSVRIAKELYHELLGRNKRINSNSKKEFFELHHFKKELKPAASYWKHTIGQQSFFSNTAFVCSIKYPCTFYLLFEYEEDKFYSIEFTVDGMNLMHYEGHNYIKLVCLMWNLIERKAIPSEVVSPILLCTKDRFLAYVTWSLSHKGKLATCHLRRSTFLVEKGVEFNAKFNIKNSPESFEEKSADESSHSFRDYQSFQEDTPQPRVFGLELLKSDWLERLSRIKNNFSNLVEDSHCDEEFKLGELKRRYNEEVDQTRKKFASERRDFSRRRDELLSKIESEIVSSLSEIDEALKPQK